MKDEELTTHNNLLKKRKSQFFILQSKNLTVYEDSFEDVLDCFDDQCLNYNYIINYLARMKTECEKNNYTYNIGDYLYLVDDYDGNCNIKILNDIDIKIRQDTIKSILS